MSTRQEGDAVYREAVWELTAALRHFGWHPAGGMPGRVEVWDHANSRGSQAVVPLDPSKRDFRHLLARARAVLVEHSGLEAQRYFDTLENASKAALDCTQFKKESPLGNGMIFWEQGETLFKVAKASLVAAAKASKAPRRYHGNASSFIGKSFLESAIMGQTDVGSFIVTAYSPANQTYPLTQADARRAEHGETPLIQLDGRQVINQLENALRAARAALDEYRQTPRVDVFGDAVEEGLSYELVAALSDLGQDSEESAVQITFAPEAGGQRDFEVTFAPPDVPVLKRAATYLATDRPPEEVRLQGHVTLLDRPDPGKPGVIRLHVTGGSEARTVRVRLESDDYAAALAAHSQDAELIVRGTLEREGQYYWLYRPSGLAVAESSAQQLGFFSAHD